MVERNGYFVMEKQTHQGFCTGKRNKMSAGGGRDSHAKKGGTKTQHFFSSMGAAHGRALWPEHLLLRVVERCGRYAWRNNALNHSFHHIAILL
jgi:hypothetical protein